MKAVPFNQIFVTTNLGAWFCSAEFDASGWRLASFRSTVISVSWKKELYFVLYTQLTNHHKTRTFNCQSLGGRQLLYQLEELSFLHIYIYYKKIQLQLRILPLLSFCEDNNEIQKNLQGVMVNIPYISSKHQPNFRNLDLTYISQTNSIPIDFKSACF